MLEEGEKQIFDFKRTGRVHLLMIVTSGIIVLLGEEVLSGRFLNAVIFALALLVLTYLGKDIWRVAFREFRYLYLEALLLIGAVVMFITVDYYNMGVLLFIVAGVILYFSAKRMATVISSS